MSKHRKRMIRLGYYPTYWANYCKSTSLFTKKVYFVSGDLNAAGSRGWFGPLWFGREERHRHHRSRKMANYVETRTLQHANAQYARLKISGRQMDLRQTGRPTVVFKSDDMK